MTSKAITIRTEVNTIDDIDALAKAMDRSRNYVVNQAMKSYVARSISSGPTSPASVASAPARRVEISPKPKKKAKKKKKKSGKKSKK